MTKNLASYGGIVGQKIYRLDRNNRYKGPKTGFFTDPVHLALDSEKIKNSFKKIKHKMPNKGLLDNIAQVIKPDNNQEAFFLTCELQYAFSQISLDKKTKD